MPSNVPKGLIRRLFLNETEADCKQFCAQILLVIIEKDAELKHYTDHIKLVCEVVGDTANVIRPYNQILDFI
jgi:hypothetical protein